MEMYSARNAKKRGKRRGESAGERGRSRGRVVERGWVREKKGKKSTSRRS
jgi:hypothetical protein